MRLLQKICQRNKGWQFGQNFSAQGMSALLVSALGHQRPLQGSKGTLPLPKRATAVSL